MGGEAKRLATHRGPAAGWKGPVSGGSGIEEKEETSRPLQRWLRHSSGFGRLLGRLTLLCVLAGGNALVHTQEQVSPSQHLNDGEFAAAKLRYVADCGCSDKRNHNVDTMCPHGGNASAVVRSQTAGASRTDRSPCKFGTGRSNGPGHGLIIVRDEGERERIHSDCKDFSLDCRNMLEAQKQNDEQCIDDQICSCAAVALAEKKVLEESQSVGAAPAQKHERTFDGQASWQSLWGWPLTASVLSLILCGAHWKGSYKLAHNAGRRTHSNLSATWKYCSWYVRQAKRWLWWWAQMLGSSTADSRQARRRFGGSKKLRCQLILVNLAPTGADRRVLGNVFVRSAESIWCAICLSLAAIGALTTTMMPDHSSDFQRPLQYSGTSPP